jgi:hypothetical protein
VLQGSPASPKAVHVELRHESPALHVLSGGRQGSPLAPAGTQVVVAEQASPAPQVPSALHGSPASPLGTGAAASVLESSVLASGLASGLGIVASIIETVPLDMPADAPDVVLPALAPEAVPVPAPALAPVLDPALAPVLAPDSTPLGGGLELPHAASHAREANATAATTGARAPMPPRRLLPGAPSNPRSWIMARPPKEKSRTTRPWGPRPAQARNGEAPPGKPAVRLLQRRKDVATPRDAAEWGLARGAAHPRELGSDMRRVHVLTLMIPEPRSVQSLQVILKVALWRRSVWRGTAWTLSFVRSNSAPS